VSLEEAHSSSDLLAFTTASYSINNDAELDSKPSNDAIEVAFKRSVTFVHHRKVTDSSVQSTHRRANDSRCSEVDVPIRRPNPTSMDL
jgi:hypothetical protein